MAEGFPKTGDVVYWKDGTRTVLNLDGVDLLTSPFPNTDEAFFKVFGENWATKPDVFGGVRGVRQHLIVDSETIGILGGLMREMSLQPNGGEWNLPSDLHQHTNFLIHAIAATKFPNGWAGSDERRKYLPGSVATDPRPKPPAVDPELARLRQQLADAIAERERLTAQAAKLEGQVEDLLKQLAEKPVAEKPTGGRDEELRKALGKEINRVRGMLGDTARGQWWRELKKVTDTVAKIIGIDR